MKKIVFVNLIIWLAYAQATVAERLLDPMPSTMQARDFSLPAVTGGMRTLKQFEGSYVLVNFWSAECQICVAELAVLQDLYDQLRTENDFEIIAIHAGARLEEVSKLLQTNPVSYQVLMDNDLKMGHWGIPQLPTTYIITPDGSFAYRAVGTRVWNAPYMVDFLREMMNGNKSMTLQ